MPNTRWLWTISVRKLDGTCIYRAQFCTSLAWEKCIEKCKLLQKSHFTKRPHSPHFGFQLNQIILRFSYETNIRSSNYGKIFKKSKRANSDDLVSTYFVRTGHVARIWNYFLTNAYFITSDTRIRKTRLIADVTTEIFKIKNCSVGNLLSVCVCLVNIFTLLPRNHRANQSQISYGASMEWGNESLFNWWHDHDGRHAHIWQKL